MLLQCSYHFSMLTHDDNNFGFAVLTVIVMTLNAIFLYIPVTGEVLPCNESVTNRFITPLFAPRFQIDFIALYVILHIYFFDHMFHVMYLALSLIHI